jgi:hypothetical protein
MHIDMDSFFEQKGGKSYVVCLDGPLEFDDDHQEEKRYEFNLIIGLLEEYGGNYDVVIKEDILNQPCSSLSNMIQSMNSFCGVDPCSDTDGENHYEYLNMGADDDCGKHAEHDVVRYPILDDTQYAQKVNRSMNKQSLFFIDNGLEELWKIDMDRPTTSLHSSFNNTFMLPMIVV